MIDGTERCREDGKEKRGSRAILAFPGVGCLSHWEWSSLLEAAGGVCNLDMASRTKRRLMAETEYDYLLVGGGLQSGLITLALRARHPETRIAIVERDDAIGGNHTWCFHAGDVSPRAAEWIAPLICHRWPGYVVRFPGFERRLDVEYSAITSDRMDQVVREAMEGRPGSRLFLGAEALRVERGAVHLAGGQALTAKVVIDARGPSRSDAGPRTAGFQKFVGLEVDLAEPHGLDRPVLMDAELDQAHGFRFMYVLPLTAQRLLLEDTYFHQSPDLDAEGIRAEIMAYAERKGYKVASLVRDEKGVLPMTWSGSLPERRPVGAIAAGFQGGWFHPATGYSLPIAARVADHIADRPLETIERQGLDELVPRQRSQSRFCHLLNRLLFRWYAPRSRRHIFERFYRLPMATVERFYALRLTWADRFRLLVGNPPRGFSPRYRLTESTDR